MQSNALIGRRNVRERDDDTRIGRRQVRRDGGREREWIAVADRRVDISGPRQRDDVGIRRFACGEPRGHGLHARRTMPGGDERAQEGSGDRCLSDSRIGPRDKNAPRHVYRGGRESFTMG